MKIAVIYLRILKKSDPNFPVLKNYDESTRRFLRTYKEFKPRTPHELIVVNCGSSEHDGMLDEIATRYETYSGGGYDCGTYQNVASKLDCDLIVALNTHVYFWRHFWLEPIAIYASMFGKGIYGFTASYQCNPHLRTPAIAFHRSVMLDYPEIIDNREKAAAFEAGENNFSLWAIIKGYQAVLVTSENAHQWDHWRKPKNIFRRGNQSNCLVWDRHTELYSLADAPTRASLERQADGK